jgi:hypothetical protein
MKFEISRQFSKNNQISNFVKIRPFGAERAGGRADGRTADIHDEANSLFRNFVKNCEKVTFATAILNIQVEIFLISICRLMTA